MLSIVSLGVGLVLGRKFAPEFWSDKLVQEVPVAPSMCPKQDCSLELTQAKEYYGKAFLLFLANVGMELSARKKQEFSNLLENPENYLTESSLPVEGEKSLQMDGNEKVSNTNQASNEEINSPEIENLPAGGFKARAKSFELEKPLSHFEMSRPAGAGDRVLLRLNGNYEGKLFLDSGRKDIVELIIDYTIEKNKKTDGQYFLQISSETGPYSTNNGNGDNQDVRLHPDNPKSIILSASPSSFFHFQNADLKLANYYDRGKKVGVAVFVRKQ